jgi:hypothetical protein
MYCSVLCCIGDRAFDMFAFLCLKYDDEFEPRCQTPADGEDVDVDADDVDRQHRLWQWQACFVRVAKSRGRVKESVRSPTPHHYVIQADVAALTVDLSRFESKSSGKLSLGEAIDKKKEMEAELESLIEQASEAEKNWVTALVTENKRKAEKNAAHINAVRTRFALLKSERGQNDDFDDVFPTTHRGAMGRASSSSSSSPSRASACSLPVSSSSSSSSSSASSAAAATAAHATRSTPASASRSSSRSRSKHVSFQSPQ